MALAASHPPNDRKRVKVYELRNNDWFDRGTGFCMGQYIDEPKIYVESEDHADRMLLETRITKDDGYQKQQDTLIVWTESNGTDMALSFQEAEGCTAIWEFVSHVQAQLIALAGPDDALSDDALESNFAQVSLPPPELGNLQDIEQMMRMASATQPGRDSLTRFIIGEEYISKLIPLVSTAEDLESLPDLHRLCNIMKTLILLNDTAIIEHVVTDDVILGVVGALEYDPDFPSHKANHRHYLADESKYKEVVRIQDPNIRKRIHHTYRLQYLKDVVLARILDDPTFSVLNSLIFYNQVDIVQHLQANGEFLRDLFGLFSPQETDQQRKKNAVHFIQQCCAIAKNLQAPARSQLYTNFIQNGLFQVINFALRHQDASVRIAGTDVLVAMIDHDSGMMRAFIFKQITEKSVPLTDTLIELLLVEVDLGVKAQIADAIKVLLDPQSSNPQANEAGLGKASTIESPSQPRMRHLKGDPQTELFIQNFYDESARKLFRPLKELQDRETMRNFSIQEVSLFSHLVEILCFFIRQHLFRSKYFILAEGLASRIAQLLSCPEKHLKLTALKFFRTCISLQDEFYNRQIIQNHLFEPILAIVYDTMPRDNLLNSACLELFEFIKKENIKPLLLHLVQTYRKKLEGITYVDTFQNLVLRYDQMQGYLKAQREQAAQQQAAAQRDGVPDTSIGPAQALASEDDAEEKQRQQQQGVIVNGANARWQGVKEMDAQEEEYFNTSDDDEDDENAVAAVQKPTLNGTSSPSAKPLVDYNSDDSPPANDAMDITPFTSTTTTTTTTTIAEITPTISSPTTTPPKLVIPPGRLSEKRRRAESEDEDDELIKLAGTHKRRSASVESHHSAGSSPLRRKTSFQPVGVAIANAKTNASGGPASASAAASAGAAATAAATVGSGKKIAISLSGVKASVVTQTRPADASSVAGAASDRGADAVEGEADVDAEATAVDGSVKRLRSGGKVGKEQKEGEDVDGDGDGGGQDDDDGGGGVVRQEEVQT